MARKKKAIRRVSRRRVTVWFARDSESDYSGYEVHLAQPRIVRKKFWHGSDEWLSSKKRGGRYNNGSVTELCVAEVKKVLGLNLHAGEAVPVTFTFGKPVAL